MRDLGRTCCSAPACSRWRTAFRLCTSPPISPEYEGLLPGELRCQNLADFVSVLSRRRVRVGRELSLPLQPLSLCASGNSGVLAIPAGSAGGRRSRRHASARCPIPSVRAGWPQRLPRRERNVSDISHETVTGKLNRVAMTASSRRSAELARRTPQRRARPLLSSPARAGEFGHRLHCRRVSP